MAGYLQTLMDEWNWNDSTVSDNSAIYRRIAMAPDHRTADLALGGCRPSPAAFQSPNTPRTGLSGHLDRLIPAERQPPRLYVSDKYGAVGFPAGLAREGDLAGIVVTDDPGEQDRVLRRSHVEVRTKNPVMGKKNVAWREVRAAIVDHCEWVQPPPTPCAACTADSDDEGRRLACPRTPRLPVAQTGTSPAPGAGEVARPWFEALLVVRGYVARAFGTFRRHQ